MAEFCKCGSLIIGSKCTNRNCTMKGQDAMDSGEKPAGSRKKSEGKPAAKSTRIRKSSKCITYNLNDLDNMEKDNV